MPDSTVIIPVFNQAALTRQCLNTLIAQSIENIVVVDDGSTDATPEILAGFGARIHVVTHSQNGGFAASCNDGAATAQTPFLVFLNNDTIPQPGWLQALENYALAHPNASVLGSKLLYPDGTVQHAGVTIGQDRYPRHIYKGFPADHPAVCKSRPFQIVTGASMLVCRRAFEEARGFESAFRNGFEDVDLCLRLGAQGHEIHYCAESVVHHFESVSPGRFQHDNRNVALYRERWFERVRPDDLQYYVADRLLNLSYEGQYPLLLEVLPDLATLYVAKRKSAVEQQLRSLQERVNGLSRENSRLRRELSACALASPELQYQALRIRIRDIVYRLVPRGSTVLVISKGDSRLLEFADRHAWHFPQSESGAYSGYHPASSTEAVHALEDLRERGARYLVIPATSLWWLSFYTEFAAYLDARYTRVAVPADICALYRLGEPLPHVQAKEPVFVGVNELTPLEESGAK